MPSNHNGFTLIELVVVVVILGVLSVIASAKFIGITSDAKIAVLKGTHGSVSDVLKMLYMKAQINNKLGDNVTMMTRYGNYQFYNGYPETNSESTNPSLYFIETFIDLGNAESVVKSNTTRTATYGDLSTYEDNNYSRIGYGTGNLLASLCYVEYMHTSRTQTIIMKTEGC